MQVTPMEVVNLLAVVSFDTLVYVYFGYKSLLYLVLGTLLGLGG
jgi:hypothetical protein